MEYLNEKYPYKYGDAIACFFSYEDTIILQGVVTWNKKLIIVKEYYFQKESMKNVANLIKFTNPWIAKNDYFAELFRSCYFADFTNEDDLMMLQDIFQELKDNQKIVYETERTVTKNRDKCFQILMKALSPALNSPYTTQSFSHRGNQDFPNPREIAFRDCNESLVKYPSAVMITPIKKSRDQINWNYPGLKW